MQQDPLQALTYGLPIAFALQQSWLSLLWVFSSLAFAFVHRPGRLYQAGPEAVSPSELQLTTPVWDGCIVEQIKSQELTACEFAIWTRLLSLHSLSWFGPIVRLGRNDSGLFLPNLHLMCLLQRPLPSSRLGHLLINVPDLTFGVSQDFIYGVPGSLLFDSKCIGQFSSLFLQFLDAFPIGITLMRQQANYPVKRR